MLNLPTLDLRSAPRRHNKRPAEPSLGTRAQREELVQRNP